jgi:ABC-type polysaccharide/polyol phosphate export permease
MGSFIQFLKKVVRYRSMIWALSLRDIKARYAGTVGGFFWALAHPIAIVFIYYFVFAVGFRAKGAEGVPFILWFFCGLVPWFFYGEGLQAVTNSVTSNAHLVKKTIFPTETLPLVSLISGLFTHGIFLAILGGLLVFYGVPFHAERLAVAYFLGCTCVLILGLGWLLAALQVFYRDIGHGLSITMNLWFWLTPIVWSKEMMPQQYRELLSLNPVYYIVEGYRGILIFGSVVWPSLGETIYFWVIAGSLLFAGSYMFRRLKPVFVDVM